MYLRVLRFWSDLQKVFSDDRQGNDQVRERDVLLSEYCRNYRDRWGICLHVKKSHG